EARKFDPNFKGPIYNRGCTDVLCCILFVLALLGYFVVGIVAWSQGDPRKVIYPTDSSGQFCGQAGTRLEKKPFLFYFNIMKCASPLVLLEFQCPTTQICVEKCPDRFLTLKKVVSSKNDQDYYKAYCKEGTDLSTTILKDGLCPAMVIPSRPFTHRCFPALGKNKAGAVVVGNRTVFDDGSDMINSTDLLEGAKSSNKVKELRLVAMKIFEDYTRSWYWILLGLVIAMVVSLIFIILMRYLAGIMVWVMIVMAILVIGYGIVHCYMEYARLKQQPGSDITLQDIGLQTDFAVYLEIRQTWLAFMIILCILEVIIVLLLIFLRKRILIAIALIKEASRAIGYVMSSLFYPLLTFALVALVIAYWAITAVYPLIFLSTSNEPVYKVFNETDCPHSRETCDPKTFNTSNISAVCPDAQCLFAFYGGETYYHKYLILFQFYNLFLFFWCANFVTALGQVTLAGAFASYYWALKKPDDLPAFPIFSSLGRALRYHTGSLAFGALILSIVQVIRVLLEYLDHKLKGEAGMAIYGKNFCSSARDAFFLLMRNIVRVAVLDKVTDFLLFLGKLLIVGLVGIFSFFFFSGRIKATEDVGFTLNYYWVPILTVVVGSYLIAHGFFSVYAMCVDTLFLCFCEDLERNDGSTDRPYFMSPELRDILSVNETDEDVEEPGKDEDVAQAEAQEQREEDQDIEMKQQVIERQAQEQEGEEEEAEKPQESGEEKPHGGLGAERREHGEAILHAGEPSEGLEEEERCQG
ncbi:choline transporter-like protein 2-like, partial [Scleropages formosus]